MADMPINPDLLMRTSRYRKITSPSGRLRQASNTSSSIAAAQLTCVEETDAPHNCSLMIATLRVETPALHIHLCQGERQRALTAQPLLQRPGIEATFSHLRYVEGNFSRSGFYRLGLVTIGLPAPFRCTLIRACFQILLTLYPHDFVDQDADQIRQSLQTLPSELLKKFNW
jgi:hypothetical protein